MRLDHRTRLQPAEDDLAAAFAAERHASGHLSLKEIDCLRRYTRRRTLAQEHHFSPVAHNDIAVTPTDAAVFAAYLGPSSP